MNNPNYELCPGSHKPATTTRPRLSGALVAPCDDCGRPRLVRFAHDGATRVLIRHYRRKETAR